MPTADICVIYNPTAGRGRALRRLERLRRTLGARADFQPTHRPGHAEELAFAAAKAGFATVAAAGGDGTVHEVANGLLRSGQADVTLAVVPIGSANDYAYSLERTPSAAQGVCRVDVGVVEAPDGRQRYFINGIGLGFNGAVTLEARQIPRLQGVVLYSLALVRALCYRFAWPLMTVTLDNVPRQTPTLALTVNLGRREGGFVLTPHAELDDGLFDYLHTGPLRRWQLLRFLPNMITGRIPTNHPALWAGRCQRVSVQSEAELIVHADGEFFSRPGEGVRNVEMRILPRALRVLAPGDNQWDAPA